MNKECRGCIFINDCLLKPSLTNITDVVCPCTICLIKTVCIPPCDQYLKYRTEILNRTDIKLS